MRKLVALAAGLLLAVGAPAADLDDLLKDLKSNDPDVRRTTIKQISELGAGARPAVPQLAAALKTDADVYVRRFAAEAIGKIGPAPEAVPALAAALKDRETRVVDAAASALGHMGAAGVKPLADLVKERNLDPALKLKAVTALSRIGKDAKEAVPALVGLLDAGGPRRPPPTTGVDVARALRLEAVVTLGKIGPDAKEALPRLEEILAGRERDRVFRSAVNTAVRQIKQ
jgi:HEAT repeat protein